MRKLWSVLSFIAVVNVIAALLFAGWLWRTDRLDVSRLRAIRAILAPTIAETEAMAAEARAEAEAEAADAARRARRADPPLPSAAQIRRVSMVDDQAREAMDRLQEQNDQQAAVLEQRARQVEADAAALRAERDAWRASIADEASRRADVQFRKTVSLYEAAAGKQAKAWLLELVERGDMEQAVAYLDAMQTRAAAKTLKALKSDVENQLATELLERIRTFGVATGAEATEDAPDDDVPADAG